MKAITSILITMISLSGSVAAAEKITVTLTGAFHAVTERMIAPIAIA